MNTDPHDSFYQRKLFALLHDPMLKSLYKYKDIKGPWEQIECLYANREELEAWWAAGGDQADHIASASDRVTLKKRIYEDANQSDGTTRVEVRHPISGQAQEVRIWNIHAPAMLETIEDRVIYRELCKAEPEKAFWWFWRFYPEAIFKDKDINEPAALLLPADTRLPDCPTHTHDSTVSALAGAMFPEGWQQGQSPKPYLVLFTFSPVQEFIKSSRKLLDFWAGSYMLHYLSARLCWYVAKEYGPDAVITPSLWGQEIIDAWLARKYPGFEQFFDEFTRGSPAKRFNDRQANQPSSLATAGFPNIIVALAPSEEAAKELGEKLSNWLRSEWETIGHQVRDDIREKAVETLENEEARKSLWEQISADLPEDAKEAYKREFEKWHRESNWEWGKLWDAQLQNTWESYWTAIPLGDPDQDLVAEAKQPGFKDWKEAQNTLARVRAAIPTPAEEAVYGTLNVGTWWGSLQARLGQSIQAVKNTRTWQIPVAPGERSTISGLYSAVHPNLLYNERFREGSGLSASSMGLFWRLMAKVYPGLFNGSEKLNAIELTKRMAWQYGGVATSLGVEIETAKGETDYEKLIRFPNLSSIAAARFARTHPEQVQKYWKVLERQVVKNTFSDDSRRAFYSKTQQPFQISKVDAAMQQHSGNSYNGVMFSSKWLADDMGLQGADIHELRRLVDEAHKDKECGFRDGSPSDWWVLVLADGDGMGNYVSGKKLKEYGEYLATGTAAKLEKCNQQWRDVLKVCKRMGPATHIGLNRALLDFSNRVVPYLAEQRFCGKVVYSGGDDVMAALPLEDLPEFLLSLRAAWCGAEDPGKEFENKGGYWHPRGKLPGLPERPLFTMGAGATMSMGIVIAHKSIPLPTVLENIWEAEKERAKKLPGKDGLCFRVIYGSGNTLEAVMKGHLLEDWWEFMEKAREDFSPVLYRLAEELPRHAEVTGEDHLFRQVAQIVLNRRDEKPDDQIEKALLDWLDSWETWAFEAISEAKRKMEAVERKTEADKQPFEPPLGTSPEELATLLRFSAFWLDKMSQRRKWVAQGGQP